MKEISDDDVVKSYKEFASPAGLIGKYLQQGKLAFRLGNIMFVHGALPLKDMYVKESDQFKYPTPWNSDHANDLDSWIDSLNKFVKDECKAWKEAVDVYLAGGKPLSIWSTIGGYNSGVAGGNLIQCEQ